jgi:hypothetical protein
VARLLPFVVAAVLTTLVGCTSTHDRFIEAGYTPAYADGYEDGRLSGYYATRGQSSRVTQDTYRYEGDTEYRRGWDDGYSVSKRDYDSRH